MRIHLRINFPKSISRPAVPTQYRPNGMGQSLDPPFKQTLILYAIDMLQQLQPQVELAL
jgi:hypothetical protein